MFDLTGRFKSAPTSRGVARLAGLEAPVMEDNETDIDQLQNRISDSIRFIEAVSPEALDGAEQALIRLPIPSSMGGGEREFAGDDFLRFFVLPNVYFHVSTTYAILRHNGVPIGKLIICWVRMLPQSSEESAWSSLHNSNTIQHMSIRHLQNVCP